MYKTSVSGLENLEGLQGPVIFAINHNAIQWDSVIVLKSLPRVWRSRVAYAAAAEITFSKLWLMVLASLVGGAFPFDRETAIRQSMEYLGGLLDSGWNIGIFPEGEQTLGQPMLPFKSGVGLLGVECRAPIVPIRIVSERGPSARFKPLLGNREVVSVYIGKPLELSPDTSYADGADRIEQAVRSLA
ncbi:MAG: 1-acyl-sn-glycerol-3-phosphate acyltransferase, partial [Chloroflexi bacterium]|nr:1-acyl-sn-glycerol-3-phosphate acyltransferase [Chloroflexota bacterium]